MIKAEFSASLLQSSVSHDPSEIRLIYWFGAQETFPIINVENNCADLFLCIFVIKTIYNVENLHSFYVKIGLKITHHIQG